LTDGSEPIVVSNRGKCRAFSVMSEREMACGSGVRGEDISVVRVPGGTASMSSVLKVLRGHNATVLNMIVNKKGEMLVSIDRDGDESVEYWEWELCEVYG